MGGLDAEGNELSSTEQLTRRNETEKKWEEIPTLELKLPLSSLRAVEFNNTIYLTGEIEITDEKKISEIGEAFFGQV